MLPYIIFYLVITFILTLTLGYLQTPTNQIPTTQSETTSELCATLAIASVCIQAFITVTVFAGTAFFPAMAFFTAFTLLCHHTVIHRHSRFEGETCSSAPFQLKDVSNHETWVVASVVAGLISWFHV